MYKEPLVCITRNEGIVAFDVQTSNTNKVKPSAFEKVNRKDRGFGIKQIGTVIHLPCKDPGSMPTITKKLHSCLDCIRKYYTRDCL